MKESNIEKKEKITYVNFGDVMEKLGQTQYSSVFINPHPNMHDDGTPYFENIRIEGDPSDYYNVKIHHDDVRVFIEKWFEYKKENSPFFGDKKVEDFIPLEYV